MKIRLAIIYILFLSVFCPAEIYAALSATDWNKILDRYESLCQQCIDMKTRAEAGEKVSGIAFSQLLENLDELRRMVKNDSGSMSEQQKMRFRQIRDKYSNASKKQQTEYKPKSFSQKEHERPQKEIAETKPIMATVPSKEPEIEKNFIPIQDIDGIFKVSATSSNKSGLHAKAPFSPIYTTHKYERNIHISIAIMTSVTPELTFGGMISISSRKTSWGGYTKFLSNYCHVNSSYNCTSDGTCSNGNIWLSGNTKRSSEMFSFGVRRTIWKNLGAYAGTGYGHSQIYWEDVSGVWAKVTDACISGFLLETGLSYSLHPVEFFAGVSTISFRYTFIEAGIGIRF